MKPFKATITVTFAAPSEAEARVLLGQARLGTTGAFHPAYVPEVVESDVKEMKQVPKDTRLHDLMERDQ